MNKFTKDQLSALDINRHIAVTANAGSGKTRILVARYIKIISEKIIDGDLNIEDIVAITFTKKAAAEMKARVIKELDSLIADPDNEDAKQLEDVRTNMIYSRISTIHSFCGQILRDFPIEANVPFNYQELDDFDNALIIEESIDFIFNEILANDSNNYVISREVFMYNIIAVFGISEVRKFIKAMLGNNENFREILKFYNSDSDLIIDFYFDKLKPILNENYNVIFSGISSFFYENPVLANAEKYSDKLNEIRNFIDKNSKKIESTNTSFDDLYSLYPLLLQKLDIKLGRSKLSTLINKNNHNFENSLTVLNKLFLDLGNHNFDDVLGYIKSYINSLKPLLKLTTYVNDQYNQTKLRLPALTFDDILLKTSELLLNNNNQVKEKIRKKIKYLLVDEFQDTNHLQYNIIKNLVSDLCNEDSDSKTNLFIVGDDKQSIYGFRSADVRVFNKSKKEIEKINADNLKISTDNTNNGIIYLKESFRMLPAITNFINYIFSNSMKASISEFDVNYSPFVNGRTDGVANIESGNNNNGTVSFLFSLIDYKPKIESYDEIDETTASEEDDDNNLINNSKNEKEASLIAKSIIEVINNKDEKYNINKKNNLEKPEFSDISILCRKKKDFSILASTFLKNRIPFEISAGSGFFQSTEIIELNSALKFFANNNDDVSLAGLLKSNMFNLNDNHLLEIAFINDNDCFWEKFKKFCRKNIDDILIYRAFNLISELNSLALKIPLTTLLNLLIEKTSFIPAIKEHYASEQIKGNILRFVDYVREYEKKGFRNIYDLIEQIDKLIDESKEPEAAVFTGNNSVKIMTVHAAKGLEFPIVYLAFTNSIEKNNHDFLIDKDYGIALKFKVPGQPNPDYKMRTIIHNFIQTRLFTSEYAEKKRLVYVGLSRAKDHLFISGYINQKKNGYSKPSGFLKIIMEQIVNINNEESLKIYLEEIFDVQNGGFYSFTTPISNMEIYRENTIQQIEYKQSIGIITELHNNLLPELIKDELMVKIENSNIPSDEKFEILSASKISSLLNEGIEFDYKYYLGLSSDKDKLNEGFFNSPEHDAEVIVGTKAGTFIHEMLQNITHWNNSEGIIDDKVFNDILTDIEIKHSSKIEGLLKDRIRNECENIIKTKFIIRNIPNLKHSKFETSYSLPINNDILVAAIDMMIFNEQGEVIICDWKTNRTRTPEDISESYRLQMLCYAYIVSFIFPLQNEFECKLLLTRLAKPNAEDLDWIFTFKFTKEDIAGFESILKENANYIKYPIRKMNKFNYFS